MTSPNAAPHAARPFLKWAGGKTQLLPAIESALPARLLAGDEFTYIEPFIGSGAVLFRLLARFPNIREAIINDINPDLTRAYATIKREPSALIATLEALQKRYYALAGEEERRAFYLEQRSAFNNRNPDALAHTALLIFLNKTCFNGLYRVNSKGQFNVPFGKYSRPKICDAATIMADSAALQKVTILTGDYAATAASVAGSAFFYFDPPYRPISKTASFNAYAKDVFDDAAQQRLHAFCETLTQRGSSWLLSNSDPKNTDPEDDFFERLYQSDSTFISRVKARRAINSKGSGRGEIHELLIANYITGNATVPERA